MKLSIITVSFNAEKSILRTLNSVRRNKTEDVEYLVIDGKSTDHTLDILKENSDIIDILISEKDNGIYDALNKGIKHSHGEYTMLLAADDELLDGALLNVFKSLKSDTDIWCGSIIQKNQYGYFAETSAPNLGELEYHCSLKNPASLFKREIFEKHGYYDVQWKCDGDRELFLRMYKKGVKFQIEDIPVVLFNEGGISTNNRMQYAIPEGKQIALQYGMKQTEADDYYGEMMEREGLKQKFNACFFTRLAMIALKSDYIYPIFCRLTGKQNNKIKKKNLTKFGIHLV